MKLWKDQSGGMTIFFAILFPVILTAMIWFQNQMEVIYVTQQTQAILDIATTGAATTGVVYRSRQSKPVCVIPYNDASRENGDRVIIKLIRQNLVSLPNYVRKPILEKLNSKDIKGLTSAETYAAGESKLYLTFEYTPRTALFFNHYRINVRSSAKCEAAGNGGDAYSNPNWSGEVLNQTLGTVEGPSGKETFYNMNMNHVVELMRELGYSREEYPFWVRPDGVKMLGDYVMVAADYNIRPKGTILECSLGEAIVVDTGTFAATNPPQLDIAALWGPQVVSPGMGSEVYDY